MPRPPGHPLARFRYGMRCPYCQSVNAEDEHRCQHCGRRLDTPVAYSSPVPAPERAREPAADERQPARGGLPRQATLFGGPKVIPFETLAPSRIATRARQQAVARPPQPAAVRHAGPRQEIFDFSRRRLPQPAGYERFEVAAPSRRMQAAAMDAVLFGIGLALATAAFQLMGGTIVVTRKSALGYAACVGALLLFYRLFWCILGRESAGMRCFRLRIVTFDGYRADWRRRLARFGAACLGLLAMGLGWLWALMDAERLAWHDQISKTYPAVDCPDTQR